MMQFNGEARHEWPEFAETFVAMGAIKGGWDEALENKLDLTDMNNKKLNKLAWCYLTLMLEGDALQELDMIADKNAYEAWQHPKVKYEPMELRDDENQDGSGREADKVQQYVEEEWTEQEVEECLKWKEQSQEEDFRVEEKCMIEMKKDLLRKMPRAVTNLWFKRKKQMKM